MSDLPRTRYITFRVSPAEMRKIREAAEAEGKNLSDHVRDRALQ